HLQHALGDIDREHANLTHGRSPLFWLDRSPEWHISMPPEAVHPIMAGCLESRPSISGRLEEFRRRSDKTPKIHALRPATGMLMDGRDQKEPGHDDR
ncbi:MAG TPA: hypothetical protein VII73_01145, partial [Caulobacteraceae bacterium]